MAYKRSNVAITKRTIDSQFIDLKMNAIPGTTVLTTTRNGVSTVKREGIDYVVTNGGLYPYRIRTASDENGSLNNKFFLLISKMAFTPVFVWFNVNGQGNHMVPDAACNTNTIARRAHPLEVKLELNDNALVVAQ